jgi:diguanylate cyclase (GGDEF)-like protein/PAS domain S-box-containing protein
MSSAGDPAKVLKLHPAAASEEGEEPSRLPTGTGRKKKQRDEHEIHPLLGRQLMEAADQDGKLQVRKLIEIVSRQYESYDSDRNSLATVMQLASDEANAMTEALERESASKLQAILDHVKDGIISCDQYGRIESLNRTAERFFGVKQSDLLSLTLDELLPELAPHGDVARALEDLAASQENTHYDLAAKDTNARHRRGELMPAEILVSKMLLSKRVIYIVCVRDTLERSKAEVALKDSEARYRVLVENAPEAVVVFDADSGKFVDCNENAVRFFKLTRAQLMRLGPADVSATEQPVGGEAGQLAEQYIQAAVDGGAPVFEWVHRDSEGREIPTEVRLVRLPSSAGKLIRGSILDITDRKRAEHFAAGERKVFERIASNASLAEALGAITDVIEQVLPQSVCCIRLYDAARNVLTHAAGSNLPREYLLQMDEVPAEIRYGSCAAAVALHRQIIVPDIDKDPFWEFRRDAAGRAGLKACWSTPIRSAEGRVLGTFATYMRRPGLPTRRDHELMSRMTQLARIAIERRRAEEALRDSEQRYRGLFDNVVEGVYQVTLDGELLSANPALVDMLGYDSLEDLRRIGLTESLYVEPEERERLLAKLLRAGELVEAEYRLKRKDGSVIVVSENARVIRDARGKVTGFEGTISDVTERKQAELRLFEEKERAQVTLQSIVDAVITTDRDGVIDYMNPVAESLTEWAAGDATGRPVRDVVHLVTESSQDSIEDPVGRAVRERKAVALPDQTMLIGRSGQEIAIQANAAPIRDREGNVVGAVMVFHDVSRERRMKRLLSYQAAHDALTGLINRREFESRLNAALETTRADPKVRHVMVYVDLDQFKVVNDTCGHPAGDQLLRQVTGLLQTRVRTADTLARLGGDEFGILLENCTLDMALRIAESLRQAIRDYRFVWQGNTMQIGASIGLVELTRATESIAALLSAADVACYAAKDGGRNRVQIYDPESASTRHREMRWVARLTSASDEGRLDLVFQPVVPVAAASGQRPHYELLLRLKDEEGNTVLPAEFIPAAERYNVMPILDRWVVDRVLRDLVPSRRDGVHEAPYTVAVNISGTTLSDQVFFESLIRELEEYEPTPGVLCFEITETAAIANLANASYIMRELTSRGCLVALDDFGTGLSSFNYLRNLPVHYLKIDGQFVQNVAEDRVDRSLVEAIVQVGRAMGIETVAERVERQEVFDVLEQIGVSYVQGYLLGRPAPVTEFPHR